MANQPRTRKRVHAVRRASDGSAFQKCSFCGVSVAVALVDMHDCESKKNVKRFKGECRNPNNIKQSFQDQPRSPFRLFMENFLKSSKDRDRIEIDQKGFDTWRNMSKQERLPYILQAEKVNSRHTKALLQEEEDMAWGDDEADSAEVVKYTTYYEDDSESFDGYKNFRSVSSEAEGYWGCHSFPWQW